LQRSHVWLLRIDGAHRLAQQVILIRRKLDRGFGALPLVARGNPSLHRSDLCKVAEIKGRRFVVFRPRAL
jgi:hypothetical protein